MANKKSVSIKLKSSGPNSGPFDIFDLSGNKLASNLTIQDLIQGYSFLIDEGRSSIKIVSNGDCKFEKEFNLKDITNQEWLELKYSQKGTACLWSHLTNQSFYNYYYGNIKPYIIEYPFAYKYHDEILQNVKDYTKAYRYYLNGNSTETFDNNRRVEIDNEWFNKAVLYNGQQSTGILELVPKPENNLFEYMKYPILNSESKTILYTKSDNFYQYNTFWALQINDEEPMFNTSCESKSIDKVVNQANMNYGPKEFKKSPLRAKDLKVRHILDNRSTVHLVSQFITTPSQISYK
jgi:hypothetical protein